MSISALIVDAHSILAQQELDHLQVFTIGACTVTQDIITSEQHESQVKEYIPLCQTACIFVSM